MLVAKTPATLILVVPRIVFVEPVSANAPIVLPIEVAVVAIVFNDMAPAVDTNAIVVPDVIAVDVVES